MIKLTFCLHRLPSLSREEFQDYWLNKHGPLVRSHAGTLRIRRYVQLHSRDMAANAALQRSRGAPEAYDGVAMLWWDSLDDIVAMKDDAAARAANLELLEDEKRFIDLARSPLWYGEEHEIVGTHD